MVDEKPEVIKQEMDQTRSALVEKIETLEQQVAQTVQQATNAVSSTVEQVKDVVGSTTEAVQSVVGSTTDAVQSVVGSTTEAVESTVSTVKETFNLSGHIDRHPWLALGGAVMAGFMAGKLIGPLHRTRSHTGGQDWTSWEQPRSYAQPEPQPQPQPQAEQKSQSSSLLSGLSGLLDKPLNLAKGVAVASLFSVLRDVVAQSLPDEWSKQFVTTVEDLNKKFGGLSLGPVKHDNGHTSDRGDGHHGERDHAKMAGQMGATERQGQESLGPVHRR